MSFEFWALDYGPWILGWELGAEGAWGGMGGGNVGEILFFAGFSNGCEESMVPGMKNRHILVVEDDANIRRGVVDILESEGYAVTDSHNGAEGLRLFKQNKYDLVLLDLMMPEMSGYDVCREIRKRDAQIPVLILTAKSQEIDKVVGLELGADDYITKPFGVKELLARVHALLRRASPPVVGLEEVNAPFQIGEATINPKTFRLRRGSAEDELTAKEVKLLQFFHAHAGEVLSRDRLLNEVWGYNYGGTTRTLDQVVVQLRRKLGDVAAEPRHLLTVHGVGYKLIL